LARAISSAFFAVIERDAHAYPPIITRAAELEDFRRPVLLSELGFEFGGFVFVVDGADLHAPASSGCDGLGRFDHFNSDFLRAVPVNVYFLRGSFREIDHTVGDERPAVGDANIHHLPRLFIGHAHQRVQRDGAVRGGEGVHVVNLAVRAATIVVVRPVPTRVSDLAPDRLCVLGNLWLLRLFRDLCLRFGRCGRGLYRRLRNGRRVRETHAGVLLLPASGKQKDGDQGDRDPAATQAQEAVVHGTFFTGVTAKPESISMGYFEVRRQGAEPELLLLFGCLVSVCF